MVDLGYIDTESLMQKAFKANCSGYVPMCEGLTLGTECQDPDVSLENLSKIISSGRKVARVQINAARCVLVTFENGEHYLATGFDVGKKGASVIALSKFLELAGFERFSMIYRTLQSIPDVGAVFDIDPLQWQVPGPLKIVDK